jgi:hypothetical protein
VYFVHEKKGPINVLNDMRHLNPIEFIVWKWIRIDIKVVHNVYWWRRSFIQTDRTSFLGTRPTANV